MNPRIARLAAKLIGYNLKVKYLEGSINKIADALSRVNMPHVALTDLPPDAPSPNLALFTRPSWFDRFAPCA